MAKFTNKRKKELLENKYILTFSKDHIIYTEDFRKKVILELSTGQSILEIYKKCGLDPNEIGLVSIKANKYNWTKEFKVIEENGKRKVIRVKGAYPVLTEDNKIKYITIEGGKLTNDYTKDEIEELKKNKYVEEVRKDKITFTKEFKLLFIKEFNNGKGNLQIFSENGLNPLLVGKRRIKACTRNWKKQAKNDPTFSRQSYHPIKKKTDEEKKKRLRDIQYLQKRVNQLEMENEFLKKVQALRKG